MSAIRRCNLLALAAALLVMAILVVGCGQAEEPTDPADPTEPAEPGGEDPDEDEPKYGGTFIVAQYSDITHLNPFMNTDGASNTVTSTIHQGLVGYRYNNEITPLLAESWETSDDGLTWTFHLRQGVKFHDGSEFTAEDVKYTYDLIMDPATKSPRLGDLSPIDRVEVVDEYTLRLVTAEPYASLLDKVATRGIISKAHTEEHGLEGYNRHPVGTGPFAFVSWQPDEKIVLERFEDYWEGRPYLDSVEFVVIPEDSVRQIAMETGEAHFNWWNVPEEDIPGMIEGSDIDVLQYLQTDFHMLILNNQHPLFEDYRARQAIAYAIDKEALVDNFVRYSGVIADGPYSEAYGYFYSPEVLTKFRHDQDKARELLADLGWEEGSDGIMVRDGESFEFDMMVRAGDEKNINELVMIQSWLRQVGITMNIQETEWSLLLERLVEAREYDACKVQFGASPDPDHYTIFHTQGGFWIGQYNNERVDYVLDRGRSVMDPAERKAYYDEYQEITSYEQAVVFLYHSQRNNTISARFRGMTSEPAGMLQLLHEVWDTQAGS